MKENIALDKKTGKQIEIKTRVNENTNDLIKADDKESNSITDDVLTDKSSLCSFHNITSNPNQDQTSSYKSNSSSEENGQMGKRNSTAQA